MRNTTTNNMRIATQDIIAHSSDDQSEVQDKFNSIIELTIKGKKALKAGGGMLLFKKKLVKEFNIFSEKKEEAPPLDLENEYQSMMLDTWIEEILRFLALKTILADHTEPCQLLPGYAVGVGWRVLMTNPSLYSKVCLSMGNPNIFDHHPADTAAGCIKETHKIKRYNATLRAYESYFDQQPQPMFWSFHPKPKEQEDPFLDFFTKLCGFDATLMSDPLSKQGKTKDEGMSPKMPLLA